MTPGVCDINAINRHNWFPPHKVTNLGYFFLPNNLRYIVAHFTKPPTPFGIK